MEYFVRLNLDKCIVLVFKDILQWIYWYPFRLFIQMIPFNYLYRMGRIFAIILFHFFASKKRLFGEELNRMFCGRLDRPTSNKIVKEAFIDVFQKELEVLLFSKLNAKNILSFVESLGLEHLDAALSKGKGVMLLFAHFGANQMIMPAIGYRGYKMSQISAPPMVWIEKLPTKKFSNMGKKALELRWKQELSLPVKHINVFSSLKDAFLCLKRNEILGIAIDGGGGKDRIDMDFLGRKALFSTGAIEIAMRTGCTVLPTFMIRDKKGYNKMIIEPPLKLIKGENETDTNQKNLAYFVELLERYVLKHPYNYLSFLALRQFMSEHGDIPFFVTGETKYEDITNKTSLYTT